MRFACESPEKAEVVLGKFLWDLRREPDVTEEGGIFSRPGAAFALRSDGATAEILAAVSREALEACLGTATSVTSGTAATKGASQLSQSSQMSQNLVVADCPAYMRGFGWSSYGMGGFEGFHEWMSKAKKAAGIDPKEDKSPLDPAEDFDFLREMAANRDGADPMAFDNWLEGDGTDFAPGIVSPLWAWRRQYARQTGVPTGWRVYTGGANAVWGVTGADQARHAAHLAQPAPWLGCSMARRLQFGAYDTFHDEGWNGLMARRTYDAMMKVKDGHDIPWMHPVGEIGGNATARWHHDYGPAAQASWRAFLRSRGEDDATPIPELATFAGLGGMALDLAGDWLTRPEHDSQPNDAAWWKKPLEERSTGIAERWFAEDADLSPWETITDLPGTWKFAALYPEKPDANGRKIDGNTCTRWFRKRFAWKPYSDSNRLQSTAIDSAGEPPAPPVRRVYLYFMPLANARHISAWEHKPNVKRRHQIYLNGEKAGEIGMSWGALDVTDLLRDGENTVAIRLSGCIWAGRCFLSTEAPESYPFADPAKNRLWALWNEWRNEARAKSVETIFDAMRQADPETPIKMMAPQTIGRSLVHRLCRDWGAWAHFTGEGSWFFPWNKRYGRLWGIQGTSELAGPADTVRKMAQATLRVFTAGLDGHEPVFLTQTYSRDPALRQWWLDRKDLLSRMGTYDIDLGAPQVLLYRRSSLADAYDAFPDPYPDAPNAVGREGPMESPWDHDWGRGTLQCLGQSSLYIDDDGILAGKAEPYPLIIDCGNEIIPPAEAEALARWVEAGGTFVALPCTGRSTPPEDAAPIRALLARAHDAEGGVGCVVILDNAYWDGLEDEGGVWNAKPSALDRVRALLAKVGFPEAVAVTDDPFVRVQPYRSNTGLDSVVCVANWHGEGAEAPLSDISEAKLTWRLPKKPARIVRYASGGATEVEFSWENGIATIALEIPAQEVQVFNAEGAYDAAEAIAYWWGDQTLKWQALKKPTLDLEPYRNGEWKDPVQELKEGWRICIADANVAVATGSLGVSEKVNSTQNLQDSKTPNGESNDNPVKTIPLDVLQFWGWPEGKGGDATKEFDIEDPSWAADGGRTWFCCGVRFGSRNFLTQSRLWLNGEEIGEVAAGKTRIFRDVTPLLRPSGNELRVEMTDGGKYTGLVGGVWLYHREAPEKSIEVADRDREQSNAIDSTWVEEGNQIALFAPAEWRGRYRVRLWLEGGKSVPLGVRVNDRRFVMGHRSNFATVRDFDITDYLRFGETNRIDLGHEWSASPKKWDVGTIRLDLFPAP